MPDRLVIATIDSDGTPFGLAATSDGIASAAWDVDESEFAATVAARFGAEVVRLEVADPDDPAAIVLRDTIPVVEMLLHGSPTDARGVPVDLRDRPAFDRRVLGEVREVAWGETASYGEIARRVGAPRAARAVGGALGRNPVSMLIPCHRIIAGDGTLGGYGGSGWVDRERQRSRKEVLLLREGVSVPRREP